MREKILSPDEFIEAFDSAVEINERTLLDYAYGGVEVIEGENRRWSRSMTTIIEISGRYFKIYWEEGLTEYQDDCCFEQPAEVEKIEYDKIIPEHTVRVVEWVDKKTRVTQFVDTMNM